MTERVNSAAFKRLKEKFGRMADLCSEKLGKALFVVVTSSSQKILDNILNGTEANEFYYLERLVDEILLVSKEMETEIDERIEDVLWQFNFNSRQYFLYYIKRISDREMKEETILGKLELLANEYKKVNQAFCERNVQYTIKYPSLQDVIGNWLSEEIAFLRTKQQLTITFSHSEKQTTQDFKIALDLSVAQFSCLIRGLMEKKFIRNSNLTELAGFLSNSVVTKRSENISVGSFRKKYYNVEEGTKKSVIDILNKLIDWLLRN